MAEHVDLGSYIVEGPSLAGTDSAASAISFLRKTTILVAFMICHKFCMHDILATKKCRKVSTIFQPLKTAASASSLVSHNLPQ